MLCIAEYVEIARKFFKAEPLVGMESDQTVDFTVLDPDSRKSLHRALYRQECRAWLLWCAIGFGGIGLAASVEERFSWEHELIGGLIGAYSCYLSFWVIYPGQKFLAQLRRTSEPNERQQIERGFDGDWRSVWDFVLPLLLPLILVFIIYLTRLLAVD